MRKLFLASESPRRRELLEKAGVSFQTFSIKTSESFQETLTVNEQILEIARRKAMAVVDALKTKIQEEFFVLAADTEVVVDQKLSGKPLSAENAEMMLKKLSNKTHEVKTGIILISYPENKELSHLETTKVTFRELSEIEIKKYVQTGEPMEKAGGYGIQGGAREFVSRYQGSFENVVGLPTDVVVKMLQEISAPNILQEIQKEISNKAKIVAVSKLQPNEKIKSFYNQGHRIFAENYVQEALDKIFGLFIDLGASDPQMEFPVVYAAGKAGWAS